MSQSAYVDIFISQLRVQPCRGQVLFTPRENGGVRGAAGASGAAGRNGKRGKSPTVQRLRRCSARDGFLAEDCLAAAARTLRPRFPDGLIPSDPSVWAV